MKLKTKAINDKAIVKNRKKLFKVNQNNDEDEWEQSKELEDMMLESDELPSNKWYKQTLRRLE